MKQFLALLFLIFHIHTIAQNNYRPYGDISTYEKELTTYDKDPEAGAVVLFDVGKSEFFENTRKGEYEIRFTRHRRIKILDDSALEYANDSIPYFVDGYGESEFVKSIEATTYNFKGGKMVEIPLDVSKVYDDEWIGLWRIKRFKFPRVQKGSIIEYKYVVETPFQVNLPDWTFQDKIPTIRSEYEVSMIPFYEYVFYVQGISKFDERSAKVAGEKRRWGNVSKRYGENVGRGVEFQDVVHTFVMNDVPAFKDESYITSINDYIIKMDFQLSKFHHPHGGRGELLSTWEKLNRRLIKHKRFGKFKRACDKYAKKALRDDLNLEGLSKREKSIKIIEYVKKEYKWNRIYSKYAAQSAKNLNKSKEGNSAEINLFLLAMLERAGIKAFPVVLSNRSHGKIKTEYPFDHSTNCVVVEVLEGKSFLTDATDKLLPYDKLPVNYINEKGLVVTKDKKGKWLLMNNDIPSVSQYNLDIQFDLKSPHADIDVKVESADYNSYLLRKTFEDDKNKIKENYERSFEKVKDVKTNHYSDINQPYEISFTGQNNLTFSDGNIVINPFMDLAIEENQLKQKKRKYPVDLIYSRNTKFYIQLHIPEGFDILQLPESVEINNELVMIKSDYSIKGKMIQIEANYYFKKSVYSSNEYARLKSYTDNMIKVFNTPLILEKLDKNKRM